MFEFDFQFVFVYLSNEVKIWKWGWKKKGLKEEWNMINKNKWQMMEKFLTGQMEIEPCNPLATTPPLFTTHYLVCPVKGVFHIKSVHHNTHHPSSALINIRALIMYTTCIYRAVWKWSTHSGKGRERETELLTCNKKRKYINKFRKYRKD